MAHPSRSAVVVSIVGGLVGGLIGAGVMSAGHALSTRIAAGDRDAAPPSAEREDDATVKVAGALSRVARRRPLSESEKATAGHLVHYGFGATMGALYGAAALVQPAVTAGVGAGFGAAVWLGAHAIVVPALGLARSPLHEPVGKEARELILHLAYGVTVGLVWKAVVRTSR
jgi:putative membrane protein